MNHDSEISENYKNYAGLWQLILNRYLFQVEFYNKYLRFKTF